MRVKFAYRLVLGISLTWQFSVCLATETPDTNDINKYPDAVRTFADNVLKYGRDTYGPKHRPLFVDGLNIHTHEPLKWISTTAIPIGISDLTFGIIVALIFGAFIFIVRYGKQCCESITWIIDTCKMNLGKGAGGKGERSNAESSVEEFSKKEIAEIKEQIYRLSLQIKATLTEIKRIRKTAEQKALEDSIKIASTEYAMKFELKRPEFEKAMKVLQVTLVKMPEEVAAYKQNVIKWIAKAQEKFDEYSPENFVQKIEAVKARHRTAQDK